MALVNLQWRLQQWQEGWLLGYQIQEGFLQFFQIGVLITNDILSTNLVVEGYMMKQVTDLKMGIGSIQLITLDIIMENLQQHQTVNIIMAQKLVYGIHGINKMSKMKKQVKDVMIKG
ncbi:unnamed protein product [Paramecium octaurelia]|uniref:Uncharacterized protein n=1 Tax=Paramecium octaurelia TaxID=43137 RepID=A0A8S1UZL9_PAROT|nr:unnamed protein product [Paramecium octaurelia]CAD8167916.1 unnamed protein product [Paramecium octaurelia]